MGQDQSLPLVDENTPTQTLESRTLEAVAKLIKDGRASQIVVMTGAGISTSAGIPDFRSPDTGLYANLARLNLPQAEAVFEISYFRNNPLPFYTLAQELYPGNYRPTITHSFINLLHNKGLLLKLFTQNIDCLEREAGLPGEMIVEAHGSFARQSCIECKCPYPHDLMQKAIREKSVPHCLQDSCNGLVKPEIVFFGEQLPTQFFMNKALPAEADLCIIMGTSLSVQPFASLPQFCSEGVPRVLINQEQVGGIGSRTDDVLVLGDCDDGVRKLAEACGWLEELEEMWAKTAPIKAKKDEKPKKSRDEQLEDEVAKLTREVEESLKLKDQQNKWLENHVDNKIARIQENERKRDLPESATAVPERKEDSSEGASSEKILRPDPQADATANPEVVKTDPGGGGLQHVFPHLVKKPSL
ncbi:NAD-dependent deacetylase sirtuin-2 [Zopfia rhizophila CBS 207.26]|uniref:NAD-dependent protein deacetylase n=1 Tax=Zopfia rhizophila CBS 207.26 TaxID=1314779 RepID=A0A6A6EVQ2_9PEZI|nr:NAD-dependent deacetylase sirtuin-2 [Zopfia rhizophila CBS 207.26]